VTSLSRTRSIWGAAAILRPQLAELDPSGKAPLPEGGVFPRLGSPAAGLIRFVGLGPLRLGLRRRLRRARCRDVVRQEPDLPPGKSIPTEPANLGHIALRRRRSGETRHVDHGEDRDAARSVVVDGEAVQPGDHRACAELFPELANERSLGELARFDEAGEIPCAFMGRGVSHAGSAAALDDRNGRGRRVVVEDPSASSATAPRAPLLHHGFEEVAAHHAVSGACGHRP
jgi:hypothetical protein